MSKVHWLALSTVSGIGGATARKLLDSLGSVEAIFDAPDEELLAIPRVTRDVVARMRSISLDAMEEELASLYDEGFQTFTWDDDAYPENLRPLHDAPPVLFARGNILPEDSAAVAIVGTREASRRGAAIAERLACELAQRGLTVVSGLAMGIDTAAHRGALGAEDGRTLAVLGSGLRHIHPAENRDLAEAIVRRGALLSELHPNSPPRGPSLMARDRIISGLSRAVIVVEAQEKSGSLDTAAKAKRQGRVVFAVPGSPGTELLLAQGAERLQSDSADFDVLAQRIRKDAQSSARDAAQLGLWG
jgi:DNA processing protein